jgi:hypothetical protein
LLTVLETRDRLERESSMRMVVLAVPYRQALRRVQEALGTEPLVRVWRRYVCRGPRERVMSGPIDRGERMGCMAGRSTVLRYGAVHSAAANSGRVLRLVATPVT